MTPELPHWYPYDPGGPPPEIDLGPDSSLVVLFATPGADEDGWAPRAAVALARQWAGKGKRVFLADLGLSRPRLHDILGEPNGEGMSDAFLYGASLPRIARAHAEGFFFAPAGTPVADGERVLGSSRWNVLSQGFSRAGAQLVVYLSAAEPGHEAVLARAERVLVLAAPGDTGVLSRMGTSSERVAAVIWPHQAGAPEVSSPSPPAAAPGGAQDVESPAAAATYVLADPWAEAPPPARVAAGAKGRPSKAKATSGSSSAARVALLVLLVLVLVVVALRALGIVEIPGLAIRPTPAANGSVPVVVPPGPPRPAGDYSLTLGSFPDREGAVARLQAEALSRQRSDLLFIVSPVELDGEVYHRLLVGPARDSGAAALRADLASTLTREDPSSWIARPTPLAFHLGSFASLEEARSSAQSFQSLNVPAYVLRVPPAGAGEHRFHVWAGAYADPQEASYLRRVLGVDDVRAPLVRRRGELPE